LLKIEVKVNDLIIIIQVEIDII